MHGLGNDFIVFDARVPGAGIPPVIGSEAARQLADRHFGIGCDQILIIRPSVVADVCLDILNSDGSQATACGNGTRCVADYVMRDLGVDRLSIETASGPLESWRSDICADHIAVDMGPARLGWNEVPLAEERDTLHVDIGGPVPAVCQSMGNPHAVLFVKDAESVDLAMVGPRLERHPLFPDRANISFVHQLDSDRFRMRVWERGVGVTYACGSGACAVGVAIARAGLGGRKNEIVLDGGSVHIDWQEGPTSGGRVIMRGPVSYVFDGQLCAELAQFLEADA